MGPEAFTPERDDLERTKGSKRSALRPYGDEGITLGDFRLSRGIAAGGMATVYLGTKCHQAGIQQLAAIKVIHPHLARDQEFVDMFLDEARIAACIHHPNVCRVIDLGNHDGIYYLAMEYVAGETWGDVLARMMASGESLDFIRAVLVYVLSQACEGLHAAHEAADNQGNWLRVVHRDISPQNLMIGYDGSVRVLDFGIASAVDRLHTTRNGVVKGRLSYMAPEQMRGAPVDRRADVWSLGVMLWEGLTGQGLFSRNTEAETVLAVTSERIPSVLERAPGAPRALDQIVARALERDVESRCASARELGLSLARFASESYVSVGAPELSERMRELFADEIAVKRALIRRTANSAERTPDSGVVAPLSPSLFSGPEPQTSSSISGYRRGLPEPRKLGRNMLLVSALSLLAGFFVVEAAGSMSEGWSPDRANDGVGVRAISQSADGAKRDAAWRPTTPSDGVPERPLAGEPTLDGEVDLAFNLEDLARIEQEAAARKQADAPPVKAGKLNIATRGAWAEIYLGARKLGTTPLSLTLPAGVHALRLRPSGAGPEVVRRVTIKPGEVTRLAVSLD